VTRKNVVVISGPSGVGKGTIIQKLINHDSNFRVAVSACTREPRQGEIDGETYYFLTKETFKTKAKNNEFVEWCEVHGNFYGTLKSEIESLTENGHICILEIDTQGAKKLRKQLDNCICVFLTPPTMKTLKERLENRKTEDSETIKRRLLRAEEELKEVGDYDYIVINDDIEVAFNDTYEIITKYVRSSS
jgi:guanylate kinase